MKDPAFLFYDGDAARDVSHMNRLERGCYFDLIQAQRKFGGFTVEQARKILGKDFDTCWESLTLILTRDNDVYFIEWVKESISNRKDFAERQRKRIQDYWDRKKEIPRNNHGISTDIPLVNENEIENEDVIKDEVELKEKTWKNNFEIYKNELMKVYNELLIDAKFITEQEKFYPGVDISLSIENAVVNYWATEAGWKNKKAKRIKDIDWKHTLTNAIKLNKVYKTIQRSRMEEVSKW